MSGGGGPNGADSPRRHASSSSAQVAQDDDLPVQLLSSGPVRTLRLNRPKALNALNTEMVSILRGHLDALAPPGLDTGASSSSSSSSTTGTGTGTDASIILLRGEGRALCSGGDVLAVVKAANSEDAEVRKQSLEFFKGEYELDYRIASLARTTGKHFISIMDGITMGGGVGLSLHAPFRIATERTMFAMPETGIGLFPDVGVTRVLARLDGPGASVGQYLGLTGSRLGGEEAYLAGLATHFVPSSNIEGLVHRLETLSLDTARDISAVDAVISEYASNPLNEHYAASSGADSANWAEKSALLGARRIALDWAFGSARTDAKAIVAALEQLSAGNVSDKALTRAYEKAGLGSAVPQEAITWAQETLKSLRTKSPRSVVVSHMVIKAHLEGLKVTQNLLSKNIYPNSEEFGNHPIARFAFLDFAFRVDMALATRFCDLALGRDFYEGVTFTLTKDPATGKRREGQANWADARIEDVDIDDVSKTFMSRFAPGSTVRGGSEDFAVPKLDIKGTGSEGKSVGSQHWTPAYNALALPSEAELVALWEGSHPASGSVAITDPEEIVGVLSSWRAGKRSLERVTKEGSEGSGRDGDKLGMLEKVREWVQRKG